MNEKTKNYQKMLQNYGTKIVVIVIYAFSYSLALNIFWRNGNIYAGGITGILQIIYTAVEPFVSSDVSISLIYFVLNLPLFIIGWFVVDRKFVSFTIIGVVFATIAIEVIPVLALTKDPIVCAVFGGAISGYSLGFALKNGVSTGGMDIVLLGLRKVTGKSVGNLSMVINGLIVFTAGFIFGWPHAFYSLLSIFVSAKATDLVYVKHKKVQVMIITQQPDFIIDKLQEKLSRGMTVVYNAEGAYQHQSQAIVITVITQHEKEILQKVMEEYDPRAFVSVLSAVEIMSSFNDNDII